MRDTSKLISMETTGSYFWCAEWYCVQSDEKHKFSLLVRKIEGELKENRLFSMCVRCYANVFVTLLKMCATFKKCFCIYSYYVSCQTSFRSRCNELQFKSFTILFIRYDMCSYTLWSINLYQKVVHIKVRVST